jgi:hypothetical protein
MHCKAYLCPKLSRIFIHIFKVHRTMETSSETRNAQLCIAHILLDNFFLAPVLRKCVPGDYAKLAPDICCENLFLSVLPGEEGGEGSKPETRQCDWITVYLMGLYLFTSVGSSVLLYHEDCHVASRTGLVTSLLFPRQLSNYWHP